MSAFNVITCVYVIDDIKYSSFKTKLANANSKSAVITISNDALTLAKLDLLQKQSLQNNPLKHFRFILYTHSYANTVHIPKPLPNEEIIYDEDYSSLFHRDYSDIKGEDGLIYTNAAIIDKQRSVGAYFIKTITSNIFKGKSIMNLSLPITIFDKRTLLELWVSQNGVYASTCLENLSASPVDQIKHTFAYAIMKFHLSGAQLKPFNPVLGETFQCKVNNSFFYLEQTSHHPPICNFYGFGRNYKIYGYNESEAETSVNSVTVYYKGKLNVAYANGVEHEVIFPKMKLSGTVVGERKVKFKGKVIVIDKANDVVCFVKVDPDERKGLQRISKRKETFPDYFKGVITSYRDNVEKKKRMNGKVSYELVKNKKRKVLGVVEGEFLSYLKFDDKVYWTYNAERKAEQRRMEYTLPSDSMFREDLYWFKRGNVDLAQRCKMSIEEVQRGDI